MKYSIIHHPSRTINPSIMRELDKATVYTDNHDEGCTAIHLKALADAEEAYEPTVIIEDDAILCHDFPELAKHYYFDVVLGKLDDIDAVSFYLGQGAPVHMQEEFRSGIAHAESTGKDFIELGNLYHAVCYMVWAPKSRELADLNPKAKMIDELLSAKLHKVAYAWPCLADHDDSQPSIVEHEGARPTIPRVAWKFRG